MSIFKRAFCAALCVTLLGGATVGLFGCSRDGETPQTPSNQTQTSNGELTLKEYSITLYEGETYTLSPQKTNAAGKVQTIKKIEYVSDSAYIASCENGVVKAVQEGQTYVHITADGMSVALFVTVKSLQKQDQVFIRFTEEQLYAEVPVQARLYTTKDGALTEIKSATWSTTDAALQINEKGVVTPLQPTESAVIKAKCTIDGVEYEVEKTVSVIEPLYYTISTTDSILASTKTYTGEENASYTQTTLTVSERNLRKDDTPRVVTGAELAVQTDKDSVVEANIAEDGKILLSPKKGEVGTETIFVQIVGSTRRFLVTVSVAHAVSTVADMDKLSLASLLSPSDLSYSYVLTNDIDYEQKPLYPIALWKENTGRAVGAQWQYLLDYENGKYSYVDRARVGETGTGLTKQEFIDFASANGINPKNTSFSGIFDGNGYAIKNAKIMLAPLITNPASDLYGAGASVFGCVRGGTIRNVEFDVSLQTPTEATAMYGDDLSQTVANGNIVDFNWRVDKSKFVHFSSTIVYYSENATVYNVYSHITLPDEMLSNRRSSGLLGWAKTATAYNNVVYVENNQATLSYYGLQGEGNAKRIENNLAVGVSTIANEYSSNTCGEDGNWWAKDSFAALTSLSVGSATKNEISYTDTIQSFDEIVWDLSGLSSNEQPTLLNGCSVR